MTHKFNLNSLTRSALFTFLLGLMSILPAHAQFSTAYNLRSIFNTSGGPEFMLKYHNSPNMALRLKFNGSKSTTRSNQNFYEDNMYSNLDKWPSDITKDGSINTNTNWGVAPGVELRTSLNDNTVFYYGIDMRFSQTKYSYDYNWHYEYKDNNTQLYVIQQVRSSQQSSKTIEIAPTPLIGIHRELGHGFSALFETSVSANFFNTNSENSQNIYIWDVNSSSFIIPPAADQFKPQDQPWDNTINWSPRFDLFIAYTFNSDK